MQKTLLISSVMAAFSIGCLAATVYAPLRVPAAQAGANVQRWEQVCVPSRDTTTGEVIAQTPTGSVNNPEKGWNRVLKQYGQEGWEFVQLGGGSGGLFFACFKRPL